MDVGHLLVGILTGLLLALLVLAELRSRRNTAAQNQKGLAAIAPGSPLQPSTKELKVP